MSGFVANNDLAFAGQLSNFNDKIGGYSAALGLSAPQLASVAADTAQMSFVALGAQMSQEYAQGWTSRKDRLRMGGASPLGPYPVAVDVTTPPADVLPGIEKRFRGLVASIKTNAAYTNDMGEDLGIVADHSEPVVTPPVLSIKIVEVSPVLSFKKGSTDGVRIYSRRGNETSFTFLATDTQSPYVDNRPNLVPGTPEKREYYAFYFENDEVVGTQGPTISITV